MELIIESEAKIDEAARKFIDSLGGRRHVAFEAPMGTGKTTFVSALCRVLATEEEATSPTFSIVNDYGRGADGSPAVYHFDFYRIDDPEEIADLGLDEYFESGGWCLMEWPEIATAWLPDDTVFVEMEVLADGRRRLRWD